MSLRIEKNNFYFLIGGSIQQRKLDLPCVRFMSHDPSVPQSHPYTIIVVLDDNSSMCTHSYDKEATLVEIPIGTGYIFPSENNLRYYIEGRYAPLLQTHSNRNIEDLSTNISVSEHSSQATFQSWTNVAIGGGIQKALSEKIGVRLGVVLKSNDFDFDKLSLGGNVRVEYGF